MHFIIMKKLNFQKLNQILNFKTKLKKMHIDRKNIEVQVELQNFTIHQLDLQTDVLKTASNSLGVMG